jgi:hypothetical protein
MTLADPVYIQGRLISIAVDPLYRNGFSWVCRGSL